MDLRRAFLDNVGVKAWSDLPALESHLLTLYETARSAWPEVRLAPSAFVLHIAQRWPADQVPDPAFSTLHVSDLYLACACLHRCQRALAALEQTHFSKIPLWLARMRLTADQTGEVQQRVRSKLLVAQPDQAPKLVEYSGIGALGGWLRVVAAREALDLVRSAPPLAPPMPPLSLPEGRDSAFVKRIDRRAFATAFKHALEEALVGLSEEESTLLRLHFLDGYSFQKLGTHFHMAKSTAADRVAAIIARLHDDLPRRLNLNKEDSAQLAELLRSHADLSLERILNSPAVL